MVYAGFRVEVKNPRYFVHIVGIFRTFPTVPRRKKSIHEIRIPAFKHHAKYKLHGMIFRESRATSLNLLLIFVLIFKSNDLLRWKLLLCD